MRRPYRSFTRDLPPCNLVKPTAPFLARRALRDRNVGVAVLTCTTSLGGNSMYERFRAASKSSDDSGFTLIELLIVIIILGVLAGIVVFAVGGITDRGAKSACKADIKNVEIASEA